MPETLWYYARNDRTLGPIPGGELKRMAATGELLPEDLVWHEGLEQWSPASKIRGLFPERTVTPPAAGTNAAAAEPAAKVITDSPPGETSPLEVVPTPPASGDSPTAPPLTPPAGVGFAPPQPALEIAKPEGGGAVFRVLVVTQIFLWTVCVLTVFAGGLLFVVRLTQTEDTVQRAAAGGLYAAFAISAYIVARAGEKVGQLVLAHAERSD